MRGGTCPPLNLNERIVPFDLDRERWRIMFNLSALQLRNLVTALSARGVLCLGILSLGAATSSIQHSVPPLSAACDSAAESDEKQVKVRAGQLKYKHNGSLLSIRYSLDGKYVATC